MSELPDFYADLDLSLARARALLERGVRQRRQAAHQPSVATVDSQGRPRQRVMVLRDVDWDARTLRFHTDRRGDKVAQVQHNAAVSVLSYDAQAKVQLRLRGHARVATGPEIDPLWTATHNYGRRCYLVDPAPGTEVPTGSNGLPDWAQGIEPTDSQLRPARANFAAFFVHFDEIEWLYLAHQGHRRACWSWDGAWQGRWLIP